MDLFLPKKRQPRMTADPLFLYFGQRRWNLWVLVPFIFHQREGEEGTIPCDHFPLSTALSVADSIFNCLGTHQGWSYIVILMDSSLGRCTADRTF